MVYRDLLPRFEAKYIPEPMSGCWIWVGRTEATGYGTINFGKKRIKAHRLSYLLYKGDIGNLCVLHKCDNRLCVNPNHLFLGTREDNNKDRNNKGREGDRSGIKNGRAKINLAMASAIREVYQKGLLSGPELAKRCGLHSSSIYRIIKNISWKDEEENRCSGGVCGI